jgi:hypothetical protein
MSDLILGPPGVLPPGEWAYGALVVPDSEYTGGPGYLLPHHMAGSGYVAQDGHHHDPWSWPLSLLRLDLTTGCLSHATRALLALVAPEVPQPDCAPVWRWSPSDRGWLLQWREADGCGSFLLFWDVAGEISRAVPGIRDEPDPRRALALALHAAAGVTP